MEYFLNAKNETFSRLPTVVFVDYETWLYGCVNQYHTEPDVLGWFNDLKSKGQIMDVFFYADLTKDTTGHQAMKLRSISNNIINCSKGEKEKDYSDFIMLDHIYQRLIRQPEIKQFVLFTGDGHFQSAAAFLRNFNDKVIGIYSLRGSLSPQLAEAANWFVEVVPPDEQEKRQDEIKILILKNLSKLEEVGKIATFSKTVTVIHRNNPKYTEDEIKKALGYLIDRNIVRKDDAILPSSGFPTKRLSVNRETPGANPAEAAARDAGQVPVRNNSLSAAMSAGVPDAASGGGAALAEITGGNAAEVQPETPVNTTANDMNSQAETAAETRTEAQDGSAADILMEIPGQNASGIQTETCEETVLDVKMEASEESMMAVQFVTAEGNIKNVPASITAETIMDTHSEAPIENHMEVHEEIPVVLAEAQ